MLVKNNVTFKNTMINGKIYISNESILTLGSNLLINSGKKYNAIGDGYITRLIVKKNGCLIIGDNVGISNTTILCTECITIGSNVLIGGNCKIWDTDFHSLDTQSRIFEGDNNIKSSPIIISDNCFIGANCIVLKGVIIGKNSIIGAGSVVTKTIPDNEIWAGNPARFIKKSK